jgi:hypothetical protein
MRGSRTLNTYVVLALAADEALAHAEADTDGSMYDSLLCIVAWVFCLEAFLNHLGAVRCPSWTTEHEPQPIKEKLVFIAGDTGVRLNRKSAQYQRVMRAIKFRDFWAHGKTLNTMRPFDRSKHDRPVHALESEWERMCTPAEARRVKAAAETYIHELWAAAGLKGHPFTTLARASGW